MLIVLVIAFIIVVLAVPLVAWLSHARRLVQHTEAELTSPQRAELRTLLKQQGAGRVCRMKIPGGNGHPARSWLECTCTHKQACRYGSQEHRR